MKHAQKKLNSDVQKYVGGAIESHRLYTKQNPDKAAQDVKQALLEAVAVIDGKHKRKRRWFGK